MYDTVAEIPVYSVVDKSRKRDVRVEDDVQYAEVEVVRRPQNKSQKKPPAPQQSETEYATINFNPENDHTRRNAPVNQYSSPLYFNPQENHTRKISPADQSRPAHRSRGQSKSTGKYNSVNGTLV
ncbi:hypothetical protein GDO81_014379 [Engystomops pustulosus]|uniref:Uncharacterized protein n=1 Tax=Engystomops pustulosus TaxID=76066 RepID=A0AAV7B9W8_ENGPU|nr:hypothetical protein GDO81_014379 [Engystomops pustulosus]